MTNNTICQKSLHEQDVAELAELCSNVALNRSADFKQSKRAHGLRVEWVMLHFGGFPHNDKTEAETSLKKRMQGFLAEIPTWMLSESGKRPLSLE